jgi:HD domain
MGRSVPASSIEARHLLIRLGASTRLMQHVDLVGEAASQILSSLKQTDIRVDEEFVHIGVVLHDAGKVLHPAELERAGSRHERAGEALRRNEGVSPAIARVCVSHANWREDVTPRLEELIIALADKLWKGARVAELEERVIRRAAELSGRPYWDLFVVLDSAFQAVADGAASRLARSQADEQPDIRD